MYLSTVLTKSLVLFSHLLKIVKNGIINQQDGGYENSGFKSIGKSGTDILCAIFAGDIKFCGSICHFYDSFYNIVNCDQEACKPFVLSIIGYCGSFDYSDFFQA